MTRASRSPATNNTAATANVPGDRLLLPVGEVARLASIERKLEELLRRASAPPRRFLTINSAAEYADLSADSIRRLIERGDLEARRPIKGRVLIDRQQLDALILGSTERPRRGRGMRTGNGRAAK